VRWVRDASGRFPRRPHYEPAELEQTCTGLLVELRRLRPRDQPYPITTDDLTVLVEQHAADLDLYADLSPEGVDVEAVTDFAPGKKPRVRIAEKLSSHPRHTNRLRTTLAHELAHVVLHNFIWWFDQGVEMLDAVRTAQLSPRCGGRRGATDWMEWQASYAASALLMPAEAIAGLATRAAARSWPCWVQSTRGRELIRDLQRTFAVSARAATIRLEQLGYLTARPSVILRSPLPRRG
jgi:IrrE N-terminal-like domain